MQNNTLKFILALSVALNIAILGTLGYWYYQNSSYRVFRHGHRRHAFLVKELSLTPDQAKTMEETWKQTREQITGERQHMFRERMDLIGLMRSENPDTKAIEQDISDIGSTQENIQKKIVAHILGVKALLNKDQQKKFFDLIENSMARKEDRQGRGGHPHGDSGGRR